MTKIKTHYGPELIEFDIPKNNILNVAMPRDVPAVTDEIAEIKKAISNPIAGKTIPDLVNPRSRVVVIIDDPERPTPTKMILPIILKEIKDVGVPDENVKIIIGCGGHYASGFWGLNDAVRDKLGTEIAAHYRWEPNEPDGRQVDLGEVTSRGTPVHVLKTVAEADVKIGITGIKLHVISGYSGGAKIILPGVTGAETINYNHTNVALRDRLDPNMLGLTESSVRLDMEEVAKIVGLDMTLNVVLRMPQKEIIAVTAGDFVKSHREAVKIYNEVYAVPMEVADATIVSDYYQYDRMGRIGLSVADIVTREGGVIVSAAPYPRAVNMDYSDSFMARKLPPWKIKDMLMKRDPEAPGFSIGSIMVSHALFRERYRVILMSEGFTAEKASIIGYEQAPTMNAALKRIWETVGKDAKINVITQGTTILPLVK